MIVGDPNWVGWPVNTDPVGVTDWPMIWGDPMTPAGTPSPCEVTSGGGPAITGAGPALTGLDPHDAHPAGPPNPTPYPGPGPIPVVTHDGPHPPPQQLANGRQQQHPDDN